MCESNVNWTYNIILIVGTGEMISVCEFRQEYFLLVQAQAYVLKYVYPLIYNTGA